MPSSSVAGSNVPLVASPLRVVEERTAADRRRFTAFPYRLYRKELRWVPPLRMAERALMDRDRNPFFQHAEVQHFLAWRGRRVVGRIAAIENRRHNEFHEDRVGFFGMFDVEPDAEAAQMLCAAARAWCASRGLSPVRGPVSYSMNDMCGVLVEGFDKQPVLLAPWNRPDYESLLLGSGFAPVKDLLMLWAGAENPIPERFSRVIDRQLQRKSIKLRPIDLARFESERRTLKELYNLCWERNWGFVPATDAEFEHAAKDLRTLLDPRISCIAEREGKPVGFSVFLKDVNVLLARGPRSGRLFPFLWLRLLLGLRRSLRTRCILLGVVPEARGSAVAEAFIAWVLERALALGMPGSECGWVLEDNVKMLSAIEAVGGKVVNRYRIYEAPAAP